MWWKWWWMCLFCWYKLVAVEFCPRLADGRVVWAKRVAGDCRDREGKGYRGGEGRQGTGRRTGQRRAACSLCSALQGVWTLNLTIQEGLMRMSSAK